MDTTLIESLNKGEHNFVIQAVVSGRQKPKQGEQGAKGRGRFKGSASTVAAQQAVVKKARSATPPPASTAEQPGSNPEAVAALVKKVLDELKSTRKHYTYEQLKRQLNVDVEANAELRRRLEMHDNIQHSSMGLHPVCCYKPKTPNITNRQELLTHLRQNTTVEGSLGRSMTGIKMDSLDDAYLGIEDDIKALQLEQMILKFDAIQGGSILFYNERDPALGLSIKLPQDVINHFHAQAVPPDPQLLQEEVMKAGLRSLMADRPQLAKVELKPKERKRARGSRAINIAKATNAHLPGLFQGSGPTEIDVR